MRVFGVVAGVAGLVAAGVLTLGAAPPATGAKIKIAWVGTKSGVIRSFGINSEAMLKAAIEEINKKGGVKVADGSQVKIEWASFDTRCDAQEAITVTRKLASDSWSCSSRSAAAMSFGRDVTSVFRTSPAEAAPADVVANGPRPSHNAEPAAAI